MEMKFFKRVALHTLFDIHRRNDEIKGLQYVTRMDRMPNLC